MENNINNTSPAAGGEQVQLRRVMKLPTLVCQGLAYLCPACVGLYYGIINALTGGNFPVSLLIAGFSMSLTAFSYSKMCREYPVSGSVYSYTTKSIGPRFGFIAGWTIMLDYFLLPMTCYLSCGLYLNVMFPAIPIWVWIIISVLICGACNYFGIGISSIVNNINVVLPILGLIFTVVFIVLYVGDGGGEGTLLAAKAFCNPETLQMTTVMTGAAIMAVVFVGFDSVTTYAEETIEPEKNMPKAVVIICIGAAIEFVIMAYLYNVGWPWEEAQTVIANPDTAVTDYNTHIGIGTWMNPVFVIMNTVACFGCCIAGQGATARILLGMGRDGFIPKKFFGYVHPKFQTPSRNILLSVVIGLCALFFQSSLTNAMSLVSFGAITGFLFTNIDVIAKFWIREKKRGVKNLFQYLIIPAVATLISGYLWLSLAPMAKIIGFSWLGLGVIFLLIKTKGFKELPPDLEL